MAVVVITIEDLEDGELSILLDAGEDKINARNPKENTNAQNIGVGIIHAVADTAAKINKVIVDDVEIVPNAPLN